MENPAVVELEGIAAALGVEIEGCSLGPSRAIRRWDSCPSE